MEGLYRERKQVDSFVVDLNLVFVSCKSKSFWTRKPSLG